METIYIIIGFMIVYVILSKIQMRNVKSISPSQLKEMLGTKNEYQFIDVRTPGEFKNRKIKGFTNLPLQNISSQLNRIDKDKTVVLICQSGSRSARAAKLLSKSGYKDIMNVSGGMGAYR